MFDVLGNPAFGRILGYMSRTRRQQLYLLLLLLLAGALSELAAIAAIVPFLAILAGSSLQHLGFAERTFGWLNAGSDQERLIVSARIFAFAAITAGAMRVTLTWMIQSWSFRLGHDLAMAIQTRLLHQPYAFHTAGNSSDLLAAHEKVFTFIHGSVLPSLSALTAAVSSVFIIAILAYIAPVAAALAVSIVAALYLTIAISTSDRLRRYGSMTSAAHSDRIRAVRESLGGIRDVILDRSQLLHLAHFESVSRRYSRGELLSAFTAAAPRYAIEAVGMVLVAAFAVAVSGKDGFASAIPVLGALALSAQRLLPLFQQVYQGAAQLQSGSSAAAELAALLDLDIPTVTPAQKVVPLPFEEEIRFSNVGFRFPERSEWVLSGLDLRISRGSRIAVLGPTGVGKSSLLDLLMGLLRPTEGSIAIDGLGLSGPNVARWQAKIAHVPQSIFLADSSVARNIAFSTSEPKIDFEKVQWAAKLAQADQFITSLPDGYLTSVGERGVRLSGGQRQRIGIARALYKEAPVLIFDEATSALDRETEAALLSGLDSLGPDLTLIMVAHRLPSIARWDSVLRLDSGRIIDANPVRQPRSATPA
jgi:ABC-type multidrug transport system fused ATPase/permease subunit